ncbi:MAG TPA: hypothetical protein VL688_10110 [Verrucomicrobiae bacterium]|jgi:hypothetical protein|nr:hypothetical protein [Verrucomicrobiae bacterium]
MAHEMVLGTVNEEDVMPAVRDLLEAEFFMQDVSVMVLEGSRSPAAVGAPAGLLGEAFGLFEGIETFFLPGLGPLRADGDLLALFLEAPTQAAEKGFAAILSIWGVSEEEGARFEKKIQEGQILVAVKVENEQRRSDAGEIFRRYGGSKGSFGETFAA